MSIGLLGTNFSENRIGILSFSFKKMHLKLPSVKAVAILSRGLGGRWVIWRCRLSKCSGAVLLPICHFKLISTHIKQTQDISFIVDILFTTMHRTRLCTQHVIQHITEIINKQHPCPCPKPGDIGSAHYNDVIMSARRLKSPASRLWRSKKTSKLRVTGLCAGNSPVTGEFPTQRASNAEKVSIWWRHHGQWRWASVTDDLWLLMAWRQCTDIAAL